MTTVEDIAEVVEELTEQVEDAPVQSSAVIVALPAPATEVPHADNLEDELHVTLLYVDNPDDDMLGAVQDLLQHLAEACAPFVAGVNGRGRLGDGEAAVLFIESEDIQALHDLLDNATGPGDDKFPSFLPHLTVGYDGDFDIETIDPATLPEQIMFDRLALWYGNTRNEYVLCGTNDDEEDDVDLLDGMALVDDDVELVVASGVSIPPVDGPDDLDAAIAYATEYPAARWYVERRARSLQAGVTLPWEPTEPTLAEPEDDDDLELNGPGGVQAAAAWYVRTCSEGGTPDPQVYDDLITAATEHDMLGDPVVASAIEWKTWVEQ